VIFTLKLDKNAGTHSLINFREPLSAANKAWPICFLVVNILVFTGVTYSVIGGSPSFISWINTHRESLLTLYGGLVLTLMIGNLVNWRLKSVLVFWSWSTPLPVAEVFKRYLPDRQGARLEARGSCIDSLPRNPAEQENFWFRIYSQHKAHPAVIELRDHFLLAQELTWLSFVLLIFFGMGLITTEVLAIETLIYAAFLILQYITASTVARSNGKRFLGNVLAVAETHKIA
jgi:hypothetical protein